MNAFVPTVPLIARGRPLLGPSAIPVRPSRSRAATRAPTRHARLPPRAQLAGNIEDMPAELIPGTVPEVPSHWHRAGVYGVYSSAGMLQYVAAVRNVGEAIANHIRYVGDAELRYAVRMITVDSVDEAPLGQIAEGWVMAHEGAAGAPAGNTDAAPEWRRERAAYSPDVYMMAGTPAEYVESEIKAILREHKIVLFMKGRRHEPRCGFSAAVVQTVEDVVGDGFVCVDCLDAVRNAGLREGIKAFSKWPTIPQLYVDGEFVGGADIVRDLEASGELGVLLRGALAPTQ